MVYKYNGSNAYICDFFLGESNNGRGKTYKEFYTDASPRRNDSDSKDRKKQGEVGVAESKSRNAWTLESWPLSNTSSNLVY